MIFKQCLRKDYPVMKNTVLIFDQTDLNPTVDWGITTSCATMLVRNAIEIGKIETDGKQTFLFKRGIAKGQSARYRKSYERI